MKIKTEKIEEMKKTLKERYDYFSKIDAFYFWKGLFPEVELKDMNSIYKDFEF